MYLTNSVRRKNSSSFPLLPLTDKLPELAQLVMENERLRRKHRKVQHRRDHYARLYYRCQADLDEKKWELHHARVKISELKEQRESRTRSFYFESHCNLC